MTITCVNVSCTQKALEAMYAKEKQKCDMSEDGLGPKEVQELRAIQRRA